MLCASVVAVLDFVRKRPRVIPLAITTMTKITHRLPFLSHMGMVLRSAAVRPPELRFKYGFISLRSEVFGENQHETNWSHLQYAIEIKKQLIF